MKMSPRDLKRGEDLTAVKRVPGLRAGDVLAGNRLVASYDRQDIDANTSSAGATNYRTRTWRRDQAAAPTPR